MKRLPIIANVDFISTSNNKNALKALTIGEKSYLYDFMEKATMKHFINNEKVQLKFFGICFTTDNKNIYGYRIPIENGLTRVKTNYDGKNTMQFKIAVPHGKQQQNDFINNNNVVFIGTMQDLEKIHNKHNELKNNDGKAIEFLLKNKYHCKFYHNNSLLNGGDLLYGNTEIKFFNWCGGKTPMCKLIEKVPFEKVK